MNVSFYFLSSLFSDTSKAHFAIKCPSESAQRALRDERNYATLRIQYVLFNFVLK